LEAISQVICQSFFANPGGLTAFLIRAPRGNEKHLLDDFDCAVDFLMKRKLHRKWNLFKK